MYRLKSKWSEIIPVSVIYYDFNVVSSDFATQHFNVAQVVKCDFKS